MSLWKRLALIPVTRLAVLSLQPGDVLLIETKRITQAEHERLRASATAALGHEVRCVIVEEAHIAGVVRP